MTRSNKKLAAIEVNNLVVGYNQEDVIDRISFSIDRGTITAIIGPNGAGKTTLLRAILGLIPVRQGTIKIFGTDIKKRCHHLRGHHAGCLHPGYVPQRFTFDKTFPVTVNEFLELALPPGEKKGRIDQALKEVGMLAHKNKIIGQLSGGQVQRVLIARSVLADPKLIILDEPAFGIDIGGEKTFYQLIEHLNKVHGSTCVIVSHEIDIVYKFADQIICLNKKMICQGVPEKVLTAETMKKVYGEEITLYKHKYK